MTSVLPEIATILFDSICRFIAFAERNKDLLEAHFSTKKLPRKRTLISLSAV